MDTVPAPALPQGLKLPDEFTHDYEVLSPLGEGAQAVVFAARQRKPKRIVAVKFLTMRDTDSRLRFIREVKSLCELDHPGIVRFYDAQVAGEHPFIVMELVEGQTLKQLLLQGPLPQAKLLGMAREAAGALGYMHDRNVVHRDIKPANLMITPQDVVKITDFGLARLIEAGGTLTATGTMVGTPQYLAPELTIGDRVTPAADIYSLGIVLYQSLTGTVPFDHADVPSLIRAHLAASPPPIEPKCPAVCPALADLVNRMLAKDPANRPADGRTLAAELDRVTAAMARPKAAPSSPARSRPDRTTGSQKAAGSTSSPGLRIATFESPAPPAPPARSGRRRPNLALPSLVTLCVIGLVGLGALAIRSRSVRTTPERRPSPGPTVVAATPATPGVASPDGPRPAPSARDLESRLLWAREALLRSLRHPVVIVPPNPKNVPLRPVRSLAELPVDELETMKGLVDGLRRTTLHSGSTIWIPNNPQTVELAMLPVPGSSVKLEVRLSSPAGPGLSVEVLHGRGSRTALSPSADLTRWTTSDVPIRHGLNCLRLLFIDPAPSARAIHVERLQVQPRNPGFAPAPPNTPEPRLSSELASLAAGQAQALAAERWDLVIELGAEVNKRVPGFAPAWHRRGKAHRARPRDPRRLAVDSLDEALTLTPRDPLVWADMGAALRDDHWYEDARRCLIYSLLLNPRRAATWLELSMTERVMKLWPEAMEHADLAAELDPLHPGRARRLKAQVYLDRDQIQQAVSVLGAALSDHPDDEETRKLLASVQGAR